MSHILITGGSGFIGREIGRLAVAEGHDVRSLSRSGRPAVTEPWVDEVEWIAADLFEPDYWRDHLAGCDAVIHTVGIIREAPKEGITFERLNGESAILAAREAEQADISAFVLLSVAGTPPFVSDRSRTAKRHAERTIADFDLRTSVLRPGAVYGEGTNQGHLPRVVNILFRTIDTRNWLARWFGDGRPLGVTAVASVALQAAVTPDTPTVLEIDDISARSKMTAQSHATAVPRSVEDS